MAVDGHQTMKRHMTTNLKTVLLMGGGVMTICDHGGTYGGEDLMSFGAANEATKNKENKSDCGLRRQPDDDFYTTTNQKYAGTMEGGSYRMRDLAGK